MNWDAISAVGTILAAVVGIAGIWLNLWDKTKKLKINFETVPSFKIYLSNNSLRTTIITKIMCSVSSNIFYVEYFDGLKELTLPPASTHCIDIIKKDISLDDEVTDREGLRKVLKCRVFPLNYLPSYKYTVICANYKGKWILSKHKKRDTWETQGGHIEGGETPLEAAKRELFEESGIRDADVYPVCDYWGFNPFRCSNGMVFLAVVHSIGELPESEMQEIGMFEELPENLTYPQTSPVLYCEAEKLLKSLERK